MNQKRLQFVLAALKQNPQDHSFVTVDTLIDMRPKCTKKSRDTGASLEDATGHTKIYKLSRRYGQAGLSYFTNVNNKLANRGLPPMVRGERKWGARIGKTMLINHKDTIYLELFASENANVSKHVYLWEDGTRLSPAEIDSVEKNFLPIPKPSKKQTEAGLDNREHTIYLNIKLQNIIRFKGYGVEVGGSNGDWVMEHKDIFRHNKFECSCGFTTTDQSKYEQHRTEAAVNEQRDYDRSIALTINVCAKGPNKDIPEGVMHRISKFIEAELDGLERYDTEYTVDLLP